MPIAESARRHGIPDHDTVHAVMHPIREFSQGDRVLLIGPATTGELLEVVVLDDDPEEDPVVIHSMKLRASFERLSR